MLGSRHLLEDASVDVETWLLTKANRSMRSVVSDAVIAGDGQGKPVGTLHHAAGIHIESAPEMTDSA